MFQLLTQAFPFNNLYINRIRTALIYGLFVFSFLAIFQPFGLAGMSRNGVVLTAAGYGLVCFLVLIACFLLFPMVFPSFYNERNWTVWKEILHTLVCVSIVAAANVLFTHFWFETPIGFSLVGRFVWNTFSVSILPITFLTLFRQVRLMRKYRRQALELDNRLQSAANRLQSAAPSAADIPQSEMPQSEMPPVTGSDEPEISPAGEFLYAESADNYTRVFSLENGTPVRRIIRSTLKRLEEDLSSLPGIYRCHRAYLVNLRKVVRITGNAQGYKLHLDHIDDPIPVSRNLNKEITALVGASPSLAARPKPLPDRPTGL